MRILYDVITNEQGYFVFNDNSEILEKAYYSILCSVRYYDGTDFSFSFCVPGREAIVPAFKDGWFQTSVSVVRNYRWYSNQIDKGATITNDTYVEKDGVLFKTADNVLIRTSEEFAIYSDVNPSINTLREDMIRVYTLQNRLLALTKTIINSSVASRYKSTISTNSQSAYARDLISSGLDAMQYSIDYAMWSEAQAIITNLLVYSMAFESLISTYYGCRCIKA